MTAIDCGIMVNPDAAINMTEGAITDGIGTALYGQLTFTKGVPDQRNFYNYRIVRINEAPKAIDVHFVKNDLDPSGMGEPACLRFLVRLPAPCAKPPASDFTTSLFQRTPSMVDVANEMVPGNWAISRQ